MNRACAWILLGMLAAGPGCAAIRPRGPAAGSPSERPGMAAGKAPAVAASEPEAGEADPFHARPTAPVARLSRYFPGLSRPEATAPASPGPGLLRRGGRGSWGTDRAREAVPRPEPEAASGDETAAAAAPSRWGWGRPSPARKNAAPPARVDPAARTASARGPETIEASAPPPPLLPAALVAEVEPDDRAEAGRAEAGPEAEVAGLPPVPDRRPVLGASGGSSLPISVRRSPPPLPRTNSIARRPLPPRTPDYARESTRPAGPVGQPRASSHETDDQARQAAARPPEGADAEAPDPSPLLAVSDPPVEVEEDRPEAPAPEAPAAEASSDDRPEADRDPFGDAPPPIVPADKDSGGDPTLVGRPRMARPPATRISPRAGLPEDLPPPLFPRTYYGEKAAQPAPDPMIAADDAPKGWSWTPRLMKRLKGQ